MLDAGCWMLDAGCLTEIGLMILNVMGYNMYRI